MIGLAEPIEDRSHNRFMGRHLVNGQWDEGMMSAITPSGIYISKFA